MLACVRALIFGSRHNWRASLQRYNRFLYRATFIFARIRFTPITFPFDQLRLLYSSRVSSTCCSSF